MDELRGIRERRKGFILSGMVDGNKSAQANSGYWGMEF